MCDFISYKYTNQMEAKLDLINSFLKLYNDAETLRKQKNMDKYRETFNKAHKCYCDNYEIFKEFGELGMIIHFAKDTYSKTTTNSSYVPPNSSIPSYNIDIRTPNSFTLNNNGYPTTVYVPELPPIQQYYSIGGPLNNTPVYKGIQETYTALETQHQNFEINFRNDMNRLS